MKALNDYLKQEMPKDAITLSEVHTLTGISMGRLYHIKGCKKWKIGRTAYYDKKQLLNMCQIILDNKEYKHPRKKTIGSILIKLDGNVIEFKDKISASKYLGISVDLAKRRGYILVKKYISIEYV